MPIAQSQLKRQRGRIKHEVEECRSLQVLERPEHSLVPVTPAPKGVCPGTLELCICVGKIDNPLTSVSVNCLARKMWTLYQRSEVKVTGTAVASSPGDTGLTDYARNQPSEQGFV